MIAGVIIGRNFPLIIDSLRKMEFGTDTHINIPIAILLWLMIYPMMLKIDFASLKNVGKKPKGLFITLFVNWLVKPFSMAFLAGYFLSIYLFPRLDRRWQSSI